MPDTKTAVYEMAAAMSANERILIFMQGAKFALEQVKAAAAAEQEATDDVS